jgi:L-aspartate semialdehyde sulfurtransferase ferredoxin
MPLVNVELQIPEASTSLPIVWRLGRLYNVVTNIRHARVTSEYGIVGLDLEGSTPEINNAIEYLKALKVIDGSSALSTLPVAPEDAYSQVYSINVRVSTAFPAQASAPVLARASRDYRVIININFASVDEEDGGTLDLTISGALLEVQRCIAYLHTTGLHVSPRQRSVTDFSNL